MALALASLAACGFSDHALESWISAPTSLTADVEGRSGYLFPETRAGGVAATLVTLRNDGRRAGLVRLHFEGASAASFEVRPDRVPIDVSESQQVEVRFRPRTPKFHEAKLVCVLNETVIRVWLAGASFAAFEPGPDLVVDPPRVVIDYDPFEPVRSHRRTVVLANAGAEPVQMPQTSGGGILPPHLEPALDSIAVTFPAPFDAIPPQATRLVQIDALSRPARTTLVVESTDPAHPRLEVPVEVRPEHYDCSQVLAPAALTFRNRDGVLSLDIHNAQGAPPCRLRGGMSISPGGFWCRSEDDQTLRGGETKSVSVDYLDDTVSRATLSFELVDDAGTQRRLVQLAGESGRACLDLPPLDFGVGLRGCGPTERTAIVRNRCASPRVIQDFSLASLSGTGNFSLAAVPAKPATIPAGGAVEVTVRHTPRNMPGPGDLRDDGVLRLEAGDTYPLELALTARVADSAQTTDWRQQRRRTKLDLLIVLDDTLSMADKRERVSRNLARFFEALAASCIDFRVAVTTTSVDAGHGGDGAGPGYVNGELLPLDGARPRFATADMSDAVEVARANANVGALSRATRLLLRPAFLAATSPGAGLGRADARFQVLVISDGGDHDLVPTGVYENAFDALDLPYWAAAVSAVIPTRPAAPAGCRYGEPATAPGTGRVGDLVTRTGGALIDICEEDWALASKLPLPPARACALESRFVLSERPFVDTLEIEVDGITVPQVDGEGALRWDYDSAANAVVFSPAAIPPSGATIRMLYRVECP